MFFGFVFCIFVIWYIIGMLRDYDMSLVSYSRAPVCVHNTFGPAPIYLPSRDTRRLSLAATAPQRPSATPLPVGFVKHYSRCMQSACSGRGGGCWQNKNNPTLVVLKIVWSRRAPFVVPSCHILSLKPVCYREHRESAGLAHK